MRVSVWDHFPAALFAGPPRGVAAEVEFIRAPSRDAVEMLSSGEADVALLPVLTVLQHPDLYDVYPAVGLSTWDLPFARLLLPGGLGTRPASLAYEAGMELEALVARVVLREHYGADVQVRSVADAAIDAPDDATLIVGPDAHLISSDRYGMDLGREWFELANYPMVWGVFAAPKGVVTNEAIATLRDAVVRLDTLRGTRARAEEDAVVQDFLENQVRLRLDDLAVASLTELCNYVYYYGAVTDYTTVPFVSLDEDDEAGLDDDEEMLDDLQH